MRRFLRQFARRPVGYDPKEYWSNRENPNNSDGEKRATVEFEEKYIAASLGGAAKILDLGPGVGRLFNAYESTQSINTLDLSTKYTDAIHARASELGLDVSQSFLDNPTDPFPFQAGSFDAGLIFQVFIHQPSDIFEHQFSEMCRVCRKLVIGSALSRNTAEARPANASHVFSHDYIAAASRRGMVVNQCVVRDGVLYFEVASAPTEWSASLRTN